MSCNTLTGLARDCGPNVRGIKTIYIADILDVSSKTVLNGHVTAITMVGAGRFYKYNFKKKSGSIYTEEQVDATSGLDGWIQVVTLVLNKREIDNRESIEVLTEGFRDLVIIVEDLNGIFWYTGGENGLNLTSTAGGSESANYIMALSGQTDYQAYTFDGTLLTTTGPTPVVVDPDLPII